MAFWAIEEIFLYIDFMNFYTLDPVIGLFGG